MNFLLKIVQGPNAGAEIALVEGMNLTFGCGDDCDIILSDTSVGEKAFELEVTSERVVAVMPGGKTVKLEPYHVTAVGASALAVGPQEGAWKSLVWSKVEVEAEKQESAEVEVEVKEPERSGRRFPFGCAITILLLLVIAALAVFAWRKYPEQTKECSFKAWSKIKGLWCDAAEKMKSEDPEVAADVSETLDDVARDYAFTVVRKGDDVSVKGDFETRIKRLEATAKACTAHPGLKVDFSDAETMAAAVRDFLTLVAEDNLKLDRIEGRKAFISGRVASREALEKIMRSMSEDVPKVSQVDCSRVAFDPVAGALAAKDGDEAAAPVVKRRKAESPRPAPKMPIAGILSVPYPCLVLNDGTRAMEGSRFGEYVVEKIAPDCITVRGAGGSFEWRP
jgi:hypothetical protein